MVDMNTRTGRIFIILNTIKCICPIGIFNKEDKFVTVPNIIINTSGDLYYRDINANLQNLNVLIKESNDIKDNVENINWLDHLYFIDGYGKECFFKNLI